MALWPDGHLRPVPSDLSTGVFDGRLYDPTAADITGVTADLNATQDDETLASEVDVLVQASSTSTQDDETLASEVEVLVQASSTSTQANQTLTSEVDVLVQASSTSTQVNQTITSEVDVLVQANLGSTAAATGPFQCTAFDSGTFDTDCALPPGATQDAQTLTSSVTVSGSVDVIANLNSTQAGQTLISSVHVTQPEVIPGTNDSQWDWIDRKRYWELQGAKEEEKSKKEPKTKPVKKVKESPKPRIAESSKARIDLSPVRVSIVANECVPSGAQRILVSVKLPVLKIKLSIFDMVARALDWRDSDDIIFMLNAVQMTTSDANITTSARDSAWQ